MFLGDNAFLMGACSRSKKVPFATAFIFLTFCGFGQVADRGASDGKECNGSALTSPACWHKLDTGPFSILAPPEWEFRQLTGVDSYVGEFVGDGVTLTFDFGRYSNGYIKKDRKSGAVITKRVMAGHTAKLVRPQTPGHGITGIYFSGASGSNALYLWGKDLTASQQELVFKMFETIEIGGPLPQSFIPPPPPPEK